MTSGSAAGEDLTIHSRSTHFQFGLYEVQNRRKGTNLNLRQHGFKVCYNPDRSFSSGSLIADWCNAEMILDKSTIWKYMKDFQDISELLGPHFQILHYIVH